MLKAESESVNPTGLRGLHRGWVASVQLLVYLAAGLSAFLLRFDLTIPPEEWQHLLYAIIIWFICKLISIRCFGLDKGWWRFVSAYDIVQIVIGGLAGSVGAGILIALLSPSGFPRSVYVLDFLLSVLFSCGLRIIVRFALEASVRRSFGLTQPIIIYGSGIAGQMLLREIRNNPSLGYRPLGYVDDDPKRKGLLSQGMRVLGTGQDLMHLVRRHEIRQVLIAIPSATGPQMVKILEYCHAANVSFKTVPGLSEAIRRGGIAGDVREVAVEDLLGRQPVQLDEGEILNKLKGKTALVTGGAGSIGSELCRQIAQFQPAAIIAFDISENGLFQIEQDMRALFPNVRFHTVIGSVRDADRLMDVMDEFQPEALFHAAAHKHVPIMERYPFDAVMNNVVGSYTVASIAAKYQVEDFIMISTDKAVHPTSVMGVSKRIAELAVRSLANGRTKFVSVRFGNVLGSNGSVVPLFKRQIAAGGPLTITHPEMRRYFMTIPEASRLVLQAASMGRGNEIFVLDMGEPVRIVDLARNLILLSGLRPDQIKIEFTGTRPGEKLTEEVAMMEEDTIPTHHEKIRIFNGQAFPSDQMQCELKDLQDICARQDITGLVLRFRRLVPDYNPSNSILERFGPAVIPRPAREQAASVGAR